MTLLSSQSLVHCRHENDKRSSIIAVGVHVICNDPSSSSSSSIYPNCLHYSFATMSQVDSAYVLDLDDADIALLPKGDNVNGTGEYVDRTPSSILTDRTESSFRLTDRIELRLPAMLCHCNTEYLW